MSAAAVASSAAAAASAAAAIAEPAATVATTAFGPAPNDANVRVSGDQWQR